MKLMWAIRSRHCLLWWAQPCLNVCRGELYCLHSVALPSGYQYTDNLVSLSQMIPYHEEGSGFRKVKIIFQVL